MQKVLFLNKLFKLNFAVKLYHKQLKKYIKMIIKIDGIL